MYPRLGRGSLGRGAACGERIHPTKCRELLYGRPIRSFGCTCSSEASRFSRPARSSSMCPPSIVETQPCVVPSAAARSACTTTTDLFGFFQHRRAPRVGDAPTDHRAARHGAPSVGASPFDGARAECLRLWTSPAHDVPVNRPSGRLRTTEPTRCTRPVLCSRSAAGRRDGGGLPERPKGTVLKTVVAQVTVGSNPTPTACRSENLQVSGPGSVMEPGPPCSPCLTPDRSYPTSDQGVWAIRGPGSGLIGHPSAPCRSGRSRAPAGPGESWRRSGTAR